LHIGAMESPSKPIVTGEAADQPTVIAGGKSRRAKAAERAKTVVKSGTVQFREHAIQTIAIDVKNRIITLPAPIATWEPVTSVEWRDLDMCVRYVIKFASGGGLSDLQRMSKPKLPAGKASGGGAEPAKSDTEDTESKPTD